LNHPTKKANPLRGSRKPLPPIISPPALPRPPAPQFYDSYLQTITPLYESFISSQGASSSSYDLGDLDRKSATTLPTNIPPLTTVPDLFFDDTFNLSNPSTWNDLLEPEQPEAGPSRPRQETLHTHLDTLEKHLLHEITLRSNAFFSALSNLQDLHSESSSCLSRIGELQTSLQEIKTQQSQKGLEIIDAHEDLRVLRATARGVGHVGEVEEGLRIAKGLVDAGDWAGGLSCLGDLVRWWERHGLRTTAQATTPEADSPEPSDLPLSTLPALADMPVALSTLTAGIAKQLEAALSSLLLSILSRDDHENSLDEEYLKSSIQPMLAGLAWCGKMDGIEDVWRDVTTTSIREGSRKVSKPYLSEYS
jgi:vacuolar protein sorting-associated protein 54